MDTEPGTVQVTVAEADRDRFAVVVDQVKVERADGQALAPKVARLREGLTYLDGPMRVIEHDPERAVVRSAQPRAVDDGKEYYEFRCEGPAGTLAKQRAAGGKVEAVPFVVPHETAKRLRDDLGRLFGD